MSVLEYRYCRCFKHGFYIIWFCTASLQTLEETFRKCMCKTTITNRLDIFTGSLTFTGILLETVIHSFFSASTLQAPARASQPAPRQSSPSRARSIWTSGVRRCPATRATPCPCPSALRPTPGLAATRWQWRRAAAPGSETSSCSLTPGVQVTFFSSLVEVQPLN